MFIIEPVADADICKENRIKFELKHGGSPMNDHDREENNLNNELETVSEMFRAACQALRENSKLPEVCPCIPSEICDKCQRNLDNYTAHCWDRYIHYKLYEVE
jgi:hypothetical protein